MNLETIGMAICVAVQSFALGDVEYFCRVKPQNVKCVQVLGYEPILTTKKQAQSLVVKRQAVMFDHVDGECEEMSVEEIQARTRRVQHGTSPRFQK